MKPFFLLIISLFVPSIVLGSNNNFGLTEAAQKSGLVRAGASTGDGGLSEFIGQIIGTALSLIAIVFFILVLYGGITWMTARGNEEQTKKALNTITAAIIGLILIMASYAITSFVFDSITSTTVVTEESYGDSDSNNRVRPCRWAIVGGQEQNSESLINYQGCVNWCSASRMEMINNNTLLDPTTFSCFFDSNPIAI